MGATPGLAPGFGAGSNFSGTGGAGNKDIRESSTAIFSRRGPKVCFINQARRFLSYSTSASSEVTFIAHCASDLLLRLAKTECI